MNDGQEKKLATRLSWLFVSENLKKKIKILTFLWWVIMTNNILTVRGRHRWRFGRYPISEIFSVLSTKRYPRLLDFWWGPANGYLGQSKLWNKRIFVSCGWILAKRNDWPLKLSPVSIKGDFSVNNLLWQPGLVFKWS